MGDKITVRNTQTGQVGTVRRRFLGTILSKDVFIEVEDGAKPYARETYKPRSAEEFLADHSVTEDKTEELVVVDDQEDEEE